MNVWILDPAQLTPYYNIALCNALSTAGCEVRYVTSQYLYDDDLPFTGKFKTDYVYFQGLNNRRLLKYPRLRRLLRGIRYPIDHYRLLQQIRQSPPDVLHIQWSRLPRLDTWFIGQVKRAGVPVVHTVHDVIPLYAPKASTHPLESVYAQADRIIVHTEANLRDFLRAYPSIHPDRISMIPHIAIPYTAIPANASRERARQILNLPLEAPIFLFFGSIRHYKGVDILLAAFDRAVKSNAVIHLIIAGLPDTPADHAILEAAARLSNVHIHNGYVPYADLWQYYMASDVVVFPYRSISQSGALITAMEFGRAVIVTEVGGLPETVDENGWVVPPENAEALGATLLEAAAGRERLRKMGERSLALIQQEYAGTAIAKATINVYNELLTKS